MVNMPLIHPKFPAWLGIHPPPLIDEVSLSPVSPALKTRNLTAATCIVPGDSREQHPRCIYMLPLVPAVCIIGFEIFTVYLFRIKKFFLYLARMGFVDFLQDDGLAGEYILVIMQSVEFSSRAIALLCGTDRNDS